MDVRPGKVGIKPMENMIKRIVEMDQTFLMCIHDIFRQKETFCNIFTYLTRHIVTLYAVNCRVFVGVFLFYFFVVKLKQA